MYNYFENSVEDIKKSINKLSDTISKAEEQYKEKQSGRLCQTLTQMVNGAEKLCNQVRLLPTYTGMPSSIDFVKQTIIEANNAYVEYTDKGWFHLSLPGLLPRKEKGDSKYIRTIAQSVMSKYFETHPKSIFKCPVVLIYQHVYSHERKERAYRDHDNIEINVINDLLALYCLSDDGPMKCRHYYTSKESSEDRTEVFIVPLSDFEEWFQKNDFFSEGND